ncbi:MAG: hypothetical protein EXQ91_06515 [Alphaproteobacteria bacterium]|nr:hypothetical protein [Alphaproteobacteria bacterium]
MNARTITVALAALALLGTFVAHAAPKSGAELWLDCQAPSPYAKGLCAGFILGIFDSMTADNEINGFSACPPAGRSASEIEGIVVQWLSKHPHNHHLNAAGLVAEALSGEYRCRDTG